MIPAQLPVGPFAPLVPLFLIVGAFTLWLWGRYAAETSGKPVAVLAVSFSSVFALGGFVWQQLWGVPQILAGPDLMIVPGRAPTAIDVSFFVDGLSLFWLALLSVLGGLSIMLDRGADERDRYQWLLLSLASAQFVLLTDNLVVLFVFWELSQIALWRLTSTGRRGERPPLLALAADFPLLLALAVCWQNFGSFHLSLLTDPETVAALGPNQRAALVLLVYCVVAAVYARSLQFPFCTSALSATERSTDLASGVVTIIVPTGLYLLLRFQPLIAAEPGAQTLLVGAGSLSALLWGGMAVTQPTLARSVVSYLAGTVGLLLAGLGFADADSAVPVLLAGSVTAGCWGILQLVDAGRGQPSRFALRAAVVIAVGMSCGVFGQEFVLNTAWSALHPVANSASAEAVDGSSGPAVVSPAVPAVILLALLLLSLALFRGLFRGRYASGEAVTSASQADSAADESLEPEIGHGETVPSPSLFSMFMVLIIGLAAAPLLSVFLLWRDDGVPISAPGVMGMVMLLALLLAYVLYSGPSVWPARIESALGGLATLCRRSFYVDELIQLTWVMPWTFLGWLAAASDRTFLSGLDRRLRDVQAGVRQSVQASISEGPLAMYLITLIMGAAVMIVLLLQG